MPRAWVYNRIKSDPVISGLISDRIYSTTSLVSAPKVKPFITYRLLAHRPDTRGDDGNLTKVETYLLMVHDEAGDYLRIDSILTRLSALFLNAKDVDAGVARTSWVEDSDDFRDEEMGTILRYCRIAVRYRS